MSTAGLSTTSTPTLPHTKSSLSMAPSADLERGSADLTLKRRPWRLHPTPWADIVSHPYKGSGTAADPFIVTWLEVDGEHPRQFSTLHKWVTTIIAAMGTLAVTMGSSILSAAITTVRHDFPGYNDMTYIMVTGIYILGFVLGPFLWGPFSEVMGRRTTYVASFVPFTIFDAAVCGAPNMGALLALRFIAGVFGCSGMTNAGGVIADMFEAQQRGLAMGIFGAAPWSGPSIGPLIGGFLGHSAGWRWVAAVACLFVALVTFATLVFLPETYEPMLLRRRAKMLSQATGKVYRAPQDRDGLLDVKKLLRYQLRVPWILLFTEPIVFILSLYMSVVFGILYMTFTSFPIVFQGYRHWGIGLGGLAFMGIMVGCNVGLAYMVFWGNKKYVRKYNEKGFLPPEARLPSAIAGALLMPIGLIWFAWTCTPASIHWIVPMLATVPFSAGMVLVFLAVQNYLVDAYLPTAACVIAAATVIRSLVGVILPLFTTDMYTALGTNWAGTLIACLGFVFVPVPLILIKYGRRIRRMTKYGREADDHISKMAEARLAQRRGVVPASTDVEEEVEIEGKEPEDIATTNGDTLGHVLEEERKSYEEKRKSLEADEHASRLTAVETPRSEKEVFFDAASKADTEPFESARQSMHSEILLESAPVTSEKR